MGKQTYADVANSLRTKKSKFEKILNDPMSAPTSRKSAELMLQNIDGKLEELFNLQQEFNGQSMGEPMMKKGGLAIKRKYAMGGEYGDPPQDYPISNRKQYRWASGIQRRMNRERSNMYPDGQFEWNNDPSQGFANDYIYNKIDPYNINEYPSAVSTEQDYNNLVGQSMKQAGYLYQNFAPKTGDASSSPNIGELASNAANNIGQIGKSGIGASFGKNAIDPKSGINGGNLLYDVAAYAPTIYNIARGLLDKPEQLNANDYMVHDKLTPNRIDLSEQRREIRGQRNMADYNVRNMATSAGSYRANAGSLLNKASKATESSYLAEERGSADLKMQADQYNIGLDAANNQVKYGVDVFNMQNRAKKDEFLGKGLEGVSNITQYNKLIQNRFQVDMLTAKAIGESFANFGVNPSIVEDIKEGKYNGEDVIYYKNPNNNKTVVTSKSTGKTIEVNDFDIPKIDVSYGIINYTPFEQKSKTMFRQSYKTTNNG